MKKIIALCLAIVLLLSFAAAGAEDKVTLTFAEVMTSPERTLVLENAIKAFEAEHPNITVELVSPPYESAETKVASMLAAGQEVDIVEIRDNSVGAWINNGFLFNLDELVTGWDGKDELVDAALLAAVMADADHRFNGDCRIDWEAYMQKEPVFKAPLVMTSRQIKAIRQGQSAPIVDPFTKRRIPTYREWFNGLLGLDISIPPKKGNAAVSEIH